jgi:hypothetical protein
MCENCKLTAMMDMPENPHPQEGREYPAGWDLRGFFSPDPAGGRVGYAEDDTLRMVYDNPGLCLSHLTIAEAFSGARMEFFYDGKFYCYRPAIMKRGKMLPPVWHVMTDPEPEEVSELDEIRAMNELESILREAGVDPKEVFGDLADELDDDE